ncbi:uncharacterized protein LOC127257208 [Andrographis paniculata]|uniref:uncharacterized protein LOC127257208 n=1 Tax=Andrographis paniculata TaxID=175694 RepID=UPI0021E7B14C|nr:uncharacterized protein LOC127257208 [Andrographis paniculata]
MLFAVEGGGFFSSSASGYTNGLKLLVLGREIEEEPMRVTPWNQYQLVDQVTDPSLQLASAKNWLVRGRAASLVCFGRTTAQPECTSHLKVGPNQNKEVLPEPVAFDESKDQAHLVNPTSYDDLGSKLSSRKSSLKKSKKNEAITFIDGGGRNNRKCGEFLEQVDGVDCHIDRKRVQWTDISGGELFEIREFEMSEDGSDFNYDLENGKFVVVSILVLVPV